MPKILYVEDNKNWRDIVGERLEREGFEVVSFDDVSAAKLYAADHEVDMFLCDGSVNASNDGLHWAQELSKDGATVLVLSGSPAEGVPAFDKGQFKLGNELVAMIRRLIE